MRNVFKAAGKAVMKFVNNIFGMRTTIYKEGSTYMVKDEFMIFGVVVGADTRKASDVVA